MSGEVKTLSSKRRLIQIVKILKKHQLTKGIDPVKLRQILEDLGPTFIKIGQIMASRQDMFSKRYCEQLIKLRANVTPMKLEVVKEVIEQEYGKSINEVFSYFDPKPLGSASIAQVHRACLKDGQMIVVKVQRPNIYEVMKRDIALVRKASRILRLNEVLGSVIDINILLDEFWQTAKEEMDFLNEAKYAQRFHTLNQEVVYIASPIIYDKYTTSKVLAMEYIEGYGLDQCDLLEEMGYDSQEIAMKLAENYIKQIVDDGFFHADPHFGNIRVRGGKIVWIDFGMMGSLNSADRQLMKDAVFAIGNNDVQKLVEVVLTLGVQNKRVDYVSFYSDMETFMNHYLHLNLDEINLGIAMQEIFTIAHKHKISMPKGISMLARGLVTIESTVMLINPQINILQIAANHVSSRVFSSENIKKELSTTGKQFYGATKNVLELPRHLNDLIDILMKGRMKVNLEVMDSSVPLATVNHMVNKLTVGIVSAGLLMASSILCTTNMEPKLLGIPAIGFIGYVTAIGLGIWLLFTVLKERRRRK